MYYTLIVNKMGLNEDLFSEKCFDLGASGIEEKGDNFLCYYASSVNIQEIKNNLIHHFHPEQIDLVEAEEENWMENWKTYFKPLKIGKRFLVKPTWELDEDPERISIIIDPKMAFGTGTHETTQLILELLPDYVKITSNVIDIGTGSAILAIAAEKLGAQFVYAFDNDPVAIENALENIELNFCKIIRCETAELNLEDQKYNLVIANINQPILLDLEPLIWKLLDNNSTVILSGLLQTDVESILNKYTKFKHILRKDKGEWSALVFTN